MTQTSFLRILLLASVSLPVYADAITFSTFVSGGSISAVEGQNNTIGFTYAGDKFVGSVYFGGNNRQLFSTDLNGGNVQKFGNLLPEGSGEIPVAGSLGHGGFAPGTVYAGPNSNIYKYADNGGAPSLFNTSGVSISGVIRGMLLDPGNSFGGSLLVTTNVGNIYRVSSAGFVTLVASIPNQDTEGLDIIPSNATGWTGYEGYLVVASEFGGMYLVSPGGVVTQAKTDATHFVNISLFESVNFVPQDIGDSGNPLEGYYVANYPVDIQKAGANTLNGNSVKQFDPYKGHLLGTSEDSSNARVWDITYSSVTGFFSVNTTPVGHFPNQAEDGIFVTAERIADASVPEPGTWMLMGFGIAGFALSKLRRVRARA